MKRTSKEASCPLAISDSSLCDMDREYPAGENDMKKSINLVAHLAKHVIEQYINLIETEEKPCRPAQGQYRRWNLVPVLFNGYRMDGYALRKSGQALPLQRRCAGDIRFSPLECGS